MTVSLDTPLQPVRSEGRQRLMRMARRTFGFVGQMARNPLTAIGGGIILLLLIVAAFAPWIAPYNPLVQDLNNALVAPNAQHWFGTDEFGRDIFSRLVYGSRITLYIVLLVSVTVGPLGLLLGVTAGYFGGKVDAVLMRVTDIFISFPSLVLALALGVLMTLPIGGADMPVVISLYNAFTGLAVSFEGYVLGNEALIIAGIWSVRRASC